MYIESSLPNRPMKVARLLSPVIEGSFKENMCLQFSYHMKGDGIGTLGVVRKTKSEAQKYIKKFIGRQGDDWLTAMVDLEPLDQNTNLQPQFQVRRREITISQTKREGGRINGELTGEVEEKEGEE